MYFTKYAVGTTIANAAHLELEPKYAPNPKRGAVAFVHGAGSNAGYCLDPYGRQNEHTYNIVSAGYAASADDNGGDTWGSDAGISALNTNITQLLTRTRSIKSSGAKVALVFGSMGGIMSLNWARQHPSLVSCIVGVIPVININDIVTNNRSGYAASINTAYGTYNESSMGATHNPYTYRADPALQGIPMLIFYGLNDQLCLPQWTQAFGAADATHRTLVPLNSGHEEASYAAMDDGMTVDFINRYNG